MLLRKGSGAAASGVGRAEPGEPRPRGTAGGRGHCRVAGLPMSPGGERDPRLNVQPELPMQLLVGFGRVIGSAPERRNRDRDTADCAACVLAAAKTRGRSC